MTSSGRYDEDVAIYVLRDCLQIAREVSSFLRILVNSSQFLGVLRLAFNFLCRFKKLGKGVFTSVGPQQSCDRTGKKTARVFFFLTGRAMNNVSRIGCITIEMLSLCLIGSSVRKCYRCANRQLETEYLLLVNLAGKVH